MLILTLIFQLTGFDKEDILNYIVESSHVNSTMDEADIEKQVAKIIQNTLFSYDLNETYNLYVVNDSLHTAYEDVLISKKTDNKIEKFGFDPYGNQVVGTEIYKVSKIAVQQSKENNTMCVYVFREGQLYEGIDILILNNEKIDKKWIYRAKENPNLMFGHTKYEYLLDQEISYIYDVKKVNHENSNENSKEKEELISEFTEKLKKVQSREVLYSDFLDENHYIYAVTDQAYKEKENILIVSLYDGTVKRLYEGSDLDKDNEPIDQIHKIFINSLANSENPNVCIVRKNEKYTKLQIIEVNKKRKVISYKGSCRQDNETGEFFGDESYKHLLDPSLPSNYYSQEQDQ